MTEKQSKKRSQGAQVIEFPKSKKSTEIRTAIQREWMAQVNKLESKPLRSPRDVLINFADILELNSVYLADMEMDELSPVIENQIDMCARIRAWLS